MSYDDKKQLNEGSSSKPKKCIEPETLKKIKSIASHVGLLVTLMIYCLIGGLVFRNLELPAEFEKLNGLKSALLKQRQDLLSSVNGSVITNLTDLAKWEEATLRPYEQAVQDAARSGLSMELVPKITATEEDILKAEPIIAERWSILQAVFFASTILTTIGYGNVFPSTTSGRVFCIMFALVGIPLTLTVIADYGKLFAEGVSSVAKRMRSKLPKKLISCVPSNQTGKKSLGALAAVLLLLIYLACGAALFMLWETNWSFFEGFYFCFVTMTTIGFGDVVPTNPKYMLFCTGYILVGLALTSTIIELVRRQYAHSWKKLQALSGPFAETLRKLGEQAGGDMSIFQTDLKRLMSTAMSMSRRKKSGVEKSDLKDADWAEAFVAAYQAMEESKKDEPKPEPEPSRKPIMQIIIYESSV
ncbi:TWiK family of potassium channels protein 7 isoform X1 [Nasonia vitripennis]|uniref:Potassium channel domain-containing protein n=2 Tax=Nasonia vitripennis TaxID=7425 RepID=A0A7M7GCF5_NASVI|nr:TWiK family of potassium channels protein 7 isoform X1 [Nasonia vitripennis]